MGASDRHEKSGLSKAQSATAPVSTEHVPVHTSTAEAPAESHPFVSHPLMRLLSPSLDPETTLPELGSDRPIRIRDTLYRRALAVADIAAAAIALVVTIILLGGDAVRPWLIAAIPLVVVVGKVIGLYDRDEHVIRKTTLEEAPALFQVATLYTLLIWLGEDVLVRETHTAVGVGPLGNNQVLGLWASIFFFMLAARATVREVIGRSIPPERCLVLGGREPAAQVSRKFDSAQSVDAMVVGRVPLEGDDRNGDGPSVLGGLSQLEELIRNHHVDRVIIAPTRSDSEQLLDAIRLVKALGVKVSVLPRLFEVVGSSVRFDDVDGLVLLGVPHWGLSKSSQFLKRGLDLVGAGVGLVILSPLLA